VRQLKSELEKSNFRYNVITTLVYLVGIIILIQLFNLQIVHGSEYREESNTKLTREATIEAARGSILDRSGNVLVSTEMKFSLEMYKSKTDDEQLNSSILLMTNILEENGDSYVDTFPISIEPFEYQFNSDEELSEWKEKYKIPETASAEEAFYLFRDKYNINSDNVKQIRQVLAIRYAITTIGYSTTRSIEISSEISRESAVELQENSQGLTGVNVVVEPTRVYHTGSLASHIIGYVSRISTKNQEEFTERGDTHEYAVDDKVGQTGIEKTFEEYLRGEDGVKQIDMSVDGTVTGEYTSQEAIGGSDIVLTIDANLQQVAEDALEANILKIREGGFGEPVDAQGGAVVVINVKTGEILAMASYPDYDPSDFYNGISQAKYDEYNNNPYHPLYSKAYQSTYAPGSTFKMVTAIAALETGVVDATTKINDSGPYYGITTGTTKPPACWYYNDYGYGHGYLNIIGAIQKSCNYYFIEVSQRMGIDSIVKYAKYFGLGSKTGIEIVGESKGTLASREAAEQSSSTDTWSAAQTAYASIGQGLNSFTPLQMAKYVAMIANGGNKLDVTIIKSINNSDGTQVSRTEIDEFIKNKLGLTDDDSEDIQISEETINVVREGMRSVTEGEGGTASSVFKDFEISVGGKTGSAEAGTRTDGWFVGFAPYDDPEIAVVAMVENGFHGYYTAEIVKEVIYEYFGMNTGVVSEDMSASYETEALR
jgi:penicillin-binding protein 2